jgi:hypothetical protein
MSEPARWLQKSFGFEAEIGDGVLRLIVFYEHGWKVGINDRMVKAEYPNVEAAKEAAVRWAREKLRMMEAELQRLEEAA